MSHLYALCFALLLKGRQQRMALEKVDLHADFLKEVEDTYIPDDTPDVDNF